jgi:RNA polymerase sigma factor (sigma-70 family)
MEEPKRSAKRRVKGQDTLAVAATIVEADTSLRGVYALGHLCARRSRMNREDSHDFASALMLLVAAERDMNPDFLDTPEAIDEFAFKTLVNVRKAGWKRDKRHTAAEGPIAHHLEIELPMFDDEDRLLDKIDAQRMSDEMLRALDMLTPREREVMVLRRLRDLKTSEIADRFGITEGRVRVYLSNATKKMRAALAASFRNGGKKR